MATWASGEEGESRPNGPAFELPRASARSALLRRTRVFEDLGARELEALAAASTIARVERHQALHERREPREGLYVVESGSFKRVLQTGSGKERIVRLLGPGDVFGAFGESKASFVRALERAACLAVPGDALRRAVAVSPDLALRLVELAATWQQEAETWASRIAFESVSTRLAAFLLEASRPDVGELRFPVNQSEIASLIGSSRETVCSVLNRFRRAGAIELQRGRIRVVDRNRLPRP